MLPYPSLAAFLAPLLLATTDSATSAPAPLPRVRHKVAVIAHRGGAAALPRWGGSAVAPENTLAALRSAIRLGVDYVEVDVRATRDGQLVLLHDRTVDRTTNGTGAVEEMDLAAVRALDAGSKFDARYGGERIPTLDEAFAVCRGKVSIYLDHKDAPTEQVVACIRRHRMQKQVVVYGGPDGLREWKRLAPEIPVMPSLPDAYRRPGGIAEFLRLCPAEVLDGSALEWTRERVAEAHAAGVKVYVDNLGLLDHAAGFRRSIEMGVDGIQTDHPDVLLEVLKER